MNRVAVITGAAGAMGSACARVLAAEYDTLLLTDVDAARLHAVAAELGRERGSTVETFVADLGTPAAAGDIAALARSFGTLGALVHTAGLSPAMAGWRDILAVDLVAVVRLLDAFASQVGPGSAAVCLASIAGHMGAFDSAMDAVLDDALAPHLAERFLTACGSEPDPGATYRLAKRAVMRHCARAAVDWGARGGRVVSLSPGLIDTGMGRLELERQPIKQWLARITPVGRRDGETVLPGRTGDIASAVAFLCSNAASFISGCDLRVDGGLVAAVDAQSSQ